MTAALLPSSPLLAGRYSVLDSAGEGGMGTVYRGHDRKIDRQVAIKVMRLEWQGDERILLRFQHESRVLARLDHPFVSRLLDTGDTPAGLPYMVLEWIEGRGLGELQRSTRLLPLARIARLSDQLLEALAASHAAGVVHGDLKPDNVLVVGSGERESLKLIDFGLAQLDKASPLHLVTASDRPGEICGTPEYMAPELLRGAPPTPAADLYAFGVLLYELLTGEPPFAGSHPAEVMSRHMTDEPVRPSLRCPERGLPPALDDLVLSTLGKHPCERPTSATELAATLGRAFASAGGEDGSNTGRIPAARRDARRDSPTKPASSFTPAVGTPGAPPEPPHLWRMRQAIGEALTRGQPADTAQAYHALASGLASAGLLVDAVLELEEGIDVTSAGDQPETAALPGLWLLLLAQARLYLRLHRPDLARARAAQALLQAALVNCAPGWAQARSVLATLDANKLVHSSE